MRSVLFMLTSLLVPAFAPPAASAQIYDRYEAPVPRSPRAEYESFPRRYDDAGLRDPCAALSLMTQLAEAEQGWYGHARTMDRARAAVCDGARQRPGYARWPSGRVLRSGPTTWHYPDGRTALRGVVFYYPSGRIAHAPGSWYYPDGSLAIRQGRAFAPDGWRVRSLREVITSTCGAHDPTCERNIASAYARHPAVGRAAEIRFAWQSRGTLGGVERPSIRVRPPPAYDWRR